MKKSIASVSLAALITMTLAGCTFQLRDPAQENAKPDPDETSVIESPGESTGEESLGGFGSESCDDRDIVVDDEGTQLVLTGSCASLTIRADNVAVTLESAGEVVVESDYVTVVAGEIESASILGSNSSIAPDSVGSVEVGGSFNTITATRAGAVRVSGDTNVVTWSEGASSATNTGSGNTIVGP